MLGEPCHAERLRTDAQMRRRDLASRRAASRRPVAGRAQLADVLRLQAAAAPGAKQETERPKSVIMIWMRGGPSHIDSFDMKPGAPGRDSRRVPADRDQRARHPDLRAPAAVGRRAWTSWRSCRGIKSNDLGDHTPHYILTGSPDRGKRPAFGAVVSHLRPRADGLPPYVSLMYKPPGLYDNEGPVYLGHCASAVRAQEARAGESEPGEGGVARAAARSAATCCSRVRRVESRGGSQRGGMSGVDASRARALDMITSSQGARRVRRLARGIAGHARAVRKVSARTS